MFYGRHRLGPSFIQSRAEHLDAHHAGPQSRSISLRLIFLLFRQRLGSFLHGSDYILSDGALTLIPPTTMRNTGPPDAGCCLNGMPGALARPSATPENSAQGCPPDPRSRRLFWSTGAHRYWHRAAPFSLRSPRTRCLYLLSSWSVPVCSFRWQRRSTWGPTSAARPFLCSEANGRKRITTHQLGTQLVWYLHLFLLLCCLGKSLQHHDAATSGQACPSRPLSSPPARPSDAVCGQSVQESPTIREPATCQYARILPNLVTRLWLRQIRRPARRTRIAPGTPRPVVDRTCPHQIIHFLNTLPRCFLRRVLLRLICDLIFPWVTEVQGSRQRYPAWPSSLHPWSPQSPEQNWTSCFSFRPD